MPTDVRGKERVGDRRVIRGISEPGFPRVTTTVLSSGHWWDSDPAKMGANWIISDRLAT